MMACPSIGGGNVTFKESLDLGMAPKLSSLSCSSIFSKYIFPLNKHETTDFVDLSLEVFQSINPLNFQLEKYLSVALLSSEDGKNHREPLNLVLVVDVSGSMGESLSNKKWYQSKQKNKLDLAKSCIKEIYSKLKDHERLGVLSFNESYEIILDIKDKASIDKKVFFKKVDDLNSDGGTSIEAGYQPAVSMMREQLLKDSNDEKENKLKPKNNRIIFITDAIISNQNEADLLYQINLANSAKPFNIFTSFIGVGVDFDTDLITKLTKVRGSSYFAVHSDEEFIKTLENDFNYIVTPLCFDVYVKLEGKGYEIEKTYGSDFDFDEENPNIDALKEMKKGGVLRIETLTAYEKSSKGLKGGVVLIKLKEKLVEGDENKQDAGLSVSIDYEDISGKKLCVKKEIDAKGLKEEPKQFYSSEGVRKALLLARYVEFVKNVLGEKKKEMVKKNDNEKFVSYFESEMKILKDKLLEEEADSLKKTLKL